LENILGIKVLHLTIDYIVDEKSQLWKMWTSEAKIVKATNLAGVTVSGLATGDRTGRMAWAGDKYAYDMKGMVLDGRVPGRALSPSGRSKSPGRGERKGSTFDDSSYLSSAGSGGESATSRHSN